MRIENEDMHFVVYFTDKEKLTGITEVLEEKLPIFVYTVSKDGSEFHIRNTEREKFNRILNDKFQDKQLSLF